MFSGTRPAMEDATTGVSTTGVSTTGVSATGVSTTGVAGESSAAAAAEIPIVARMTHEIKIVRITAALLRDALMRLCCFNDSAERICYSKDFFDDDTPSPKQKGSISLSSELPSSQRIRDVMQGRCPRVLPKVSIVLA